MTFRFNPFTNKLDLVDKRGIAAVDSFQVDASTAPGTNPVVPDGSGIVTITGNQVAAGTIGAHVVQTDSLAANTYTIEIQRSASAASEDSTKNGVSHFNSSQFSVDSNAFVSLSGSVSTSYVEDDGSTATPALNILNVLTNETSSNNDHGIQSRGSGNTITIYLTNRITGNVTTADATPTTSLTLPLGATPAVFVIEGNTTALDTTDVAGGSYTFSGAARTDGATATLFGSEFINQFEEAAMGPSNVELTASGNNILVQVLGIAATTIHWSTVLTYRVVT